jgi:L-alanine-DL-glutamate epimerase-like enolase superfamily enzyme
MKITNIRLQRLRLDMDPPFHAAWDPVPRRHFDATLVFVDTDEGLVGIGSGDTMDGFDGFADLFIGTDPLNIVERVARIESLNFHAAGSGRWRSPSGTSSARSPTSRWPGYSAAHGRNCPPTRPPANSATRANGPSPRWRSARLGSGP